MKFFKEIQQPDAYQRDEINAKSGFGKDSYAYQMDGGANDEDHEGDARREQQVQSGTWYIRLNGKLIKDKSGKPYSFRGKAAANKAALTMQAKLFNQGKEFMLTTNPNDKPQGVAEASPTSMYYSEELAQKVFDLNPNLDASGKADAVLDAGWPIAVKDLGAKSANSKFAYDEDFPSDFVSMYAQLQKQGVSEGKAFVMPASMGSKEDYAARDAWIAKIQKQYPTAEIMTARSQPIAKAMITDETGNRKTIAKFPETQGVAEGEGNREMWDRVRSKGVVPGIDREKYTERPGLEGPFSTKSGKVVYYDKQEGKYYDPGTDFYISHDDYQAMNEQSVVEGYEDSPVAGAITRRILLQRSDLLSKYGPVSVTAAIDNVADYVGDVEEIGSSDVSGWIKQVEKMLQDNPPEAFGTGLNEFAPAGSGDDGNDGFSDDTLKRLAAQWWNGDEDPKVEQTLLAAGWEIGQDEGYDDGGVFVVQAGDVNGNSYMSWPAEELQLDEANLASMRDYFSQSDDNTVAVDTEYGAPERKQPANVPPEIQTLINKMYRVGKITPQEFDILKRFQAKTGMNVGIKEADMTTGNQGYDSMLAVMKAVEAGHDATFNLGGEPITLDYNEARFLAGKYKAFLKAGRQEEFLKYMESPMSFDRLMKQLRDLMDKQKNFKGSVQGERGIEESSQRVDSLVTNGLKIMRGPTRDDAIAALKTQVGERDFSERRGFYNFYVRQLMDMYSQQGVTEGIVDAIKTGTKKAFKALTGPDDEELLQRLEKETGGKRPEKKDSLPAVKENESSIRDDLAYEIGVILDGAAAGNDQTDSIIDDLGDIFNDIADSGDRAAMMAYEMMADTIDTDARTQANAARKALKLLENKSVNEKMSPVKENEYWCKLDHTAKLIPEGYKKLSSGYITRILG